MSQLHERPSERFGRLIGEAIDILRELGMSWPVVLSTVVSCVRGAEELEQQAEDELDGFEEGAEVVQLLPPFCPLDDEMGAA